MTTPTPEQAQALLTAQTPAQYAQAAAGIPGLTEAAQQMAASGAAPVTAPSFEELLEQANQRNAALQGQINTLSSNFQAQLAKLQGDFQGIVSAMPAKVDPVTESAGKVVAAFKSLPASDARNILHSAVSSHLVSLGLTDLAKVL